MWLNSGGTSPRSSVSSISDGGGDIRNIVRMSWIVFCKFARSVLLSTGRLAPIAGLVPAARRIAALSYGSLSVGSNTPVRTGT